MALIPNSNIRTVVNGQRADRVTIVQESGNPVPVEFNPAENITISNINIISADTEQSLALQSNLKQIMIRVRTPKQAELKISFTSGQSGTNYITIPKGNSFSLSDFKFASETLYFQSTEDSTTVEIIQLN